MQNLTQLMERALPQCDRAMTYLVSTRLAEMFPGQAVLECYTYFDVNGFVRYGNGEATLVGRMATQECVRWLGHDQGLRRSLLSSWIEVEWQGQRFQVVRVRQEQCGYIHWVVGEEPQVEAFVAAVMRYSCQRSPSTHVYSGWWSDSDSSDRAIQQAVWDDLVLPAEIESLIEMHAIGFFDAREDFEQLGVAWKRGLLLTGPPGNGKTHLIRAILNRLAVPRLIVKNFGDDPDDVQEVFDKVREMAPCVLVLEDIDSLIRKDLLSAVLNSLDGTEPLHGVLVLATTNHPERLDPAIRNRPSRFDRVVEFGLPAVEERMRLLRKLLSRVPTEARLRGRQLRRAAELTDGFSYAYLKELAISASVVWAQDRIPGGMFQVIRQLVPELVSQMRATEGAEDRVTGEE